MKAWPAQWWWQGVPVGPSGHSRLVGQSQEPLEGWAVSLEGSGLVERMEAQQSHL